MEPINFMEISKQIIEANGEQGKITSLLTQLQEGYETLYSEHAQLTEQKQLLEKENGELKQYNFDLFMKRGTQVNETKQQDDKSSEQKRAETITTADLFKEE